MSGDADQPSASLLSSCGLQGGNQHRRTVITVRTAATERREQPVDRRHIVLGECVDTRNATIVRDGTGSEEHHVGGTRDHQLHSSGPADGTQRRAQRDDNRQRECAGFGVGRLHVALEHELDRQLFELGMMRLYRDRLCDDVARDHGFGNGIDTPGQQTEQLQQALESFTFRAQRDGRGPEGRRLLFGQIGRRGDGTDTVAQAMCQPAQQIVMYGEPTGRPETGRVQRLAAH